jgi:hypothetical protein
MTLDTKNDELQRIITRQHNQIQALAAAQLFTIETLIEIGPQAGVSPAEIEVLKGQHQALQTIRQKN